MKTLFLFLMSATLGAQSFTGLQTGGASYPGIQSGAYAYCAGAGTSTAQTCSPTPAAAAYTTGMVVNFRPGTTSGATMTLNVSSLGVKSILKADGTALNTGDLVSGVLYSLWYDGTAFRMPASTAVGSSGLTSVGLTMPGIFSVSGSPLTSNGSITVSLATQTANTVFRSSGGTPSFGALVAADIPSLDAAKTTSGIFDPARLCAGTPSNTTFCRGDGIWAVPAGGGGGSSVAFTPSRATSLVMNIAQNAAVRVNSSVCSTAGSSNFTISAGSGYALVELTPLCTYNVKHESAIVLSCDASCTATPGTTPAFTTGSLPLAMVTASGGTWTTSITNYSTIAGWESIACGSGLTETVVSGIRTCNVATTIPTLSGTNVYTGAQNMSGASSLIPPRASGAPVTTCDATNVGRIQVRTDVVSSGSAGYVCTQTGSGTYAWVQAGGGGAVASTTWIVQAPTAAFSGGAYRDADLEGGVIVTPSGSIVYTPLYQATGSVTTVNVQAFWQPGMEGTGAATVSVSLGCVASGQNFADPTYGTAVTSGTGTPAYRKSRTASFASVALGSACTAPNVPALKITHSSSNALYFSAVHVTKVN